MVAERADLLTAIDRYHRADGELNDLTTALEEESEPRTPPSEHRDAADDDAPIVRFVNLLVSQAIQDRASDIHIEPAEHDLRVRYRIDGVLHEMQRAPKNIQNGVISRLKIMSDIDIAERRKPQDGRMSVMHAGRKIDLRVATLPTVWGEKVVMRILDNAASNMELQRPQPAGPQLRAYKDSYTKPYGMILVTGPTGSGKSTTLYTTLHAVARPEINVITVEDPVEYRMPGINQVQVNPKAGLTFASALRSILRVDPDVVLLGEIRDHETAQIAIEAVAHRPPRAVDPAHQRRAERRSPGSPRWTSSRSWSAPPWTASSPSGSPAGSATAARRPTEPSRSSWPRCGFAVDPDGRCRRCTGRSAARPARTPATAAASRSTRSWRSPRRSSASPSPGPPAPTSPGPRGNRGC